LGIAGQEFDNFVKAFLYQSKLKFESFTLKTNITRFSDRVDDYIKYRPHYPHRLIGLLTEKIKFNISQIVADIGSGTGISTELFLSNGNRVYAVEPNKEMREAAEVSFLSSKKFISVNGTAEKTNLDDKSIDIIFSGQAFHWFDKWIAKIEFARILKPGGHIVLVWNLRKEKDYFQKEYKKILQQIPEYADVKHTNIKDNHISEFFSPKRMYKNSLENFQSFNLEGLKGRLLSSSYCPKTGPLHENLMMQIEALFSKFEEHGFINFFYETTIYWC
jgi:ubiquinone/menaquinone biosynthesis C-methylase UbiE